MKPFGWIGLVWLCWFDLVALFLWCLVCPWGFKDTQMMMDRLTLMITLILPWETGPYPLPNRLLHARSITPPKVLQKGDPKAKTNECPLKINGLEDVFPIGMNFLFREHSLVFRGCS